MTHYDDCEASRYTMMIHAAMLATEARARREYQCGPQEGWMVAYEAAATANRLRAENEWLRARLPLGGTDGEL